jgi:hypothetical protein
LREWRARSHRAAVTARVVSALPLLAVCLCCLWLAVDEGGFYPRTWTAVVVVLSALVLALVTTAWEGRASLARPALVALVALAGFAAWSFATSLWAGSPGDAARGALLTAIYLAAFAVPLLWPASPGATERIVLGLAGAVAVLGAVGVGRILDGTTPLVYGRLAWPTGYPNTTAAFLALGAWLGLVVAASGTCGLLLRSAGFAAFVWIAGLLVVARSQGALVTGVLAALVLVVLSRRRLEAVALLVLGLLLVAPAVPSLARVVNEYPEDQPAALRHAVWVLAAVTIVSVPSFLLLGPLLGRVRPRRPGLRTRVAIVGATAAVLLVAGVAVSSARVAAAWRDLTAGPAATTSASRYYGAGLAGNRADFWRVGLQALARDPVGGIGVDNFQATYLRERRSDEQPRSPHNLVVTVLSEMGVVGGALLAVFVGGAALVLVRTARGGDAATGTAAQAAVVGLVGWLGHAQLDWLWEMPATGALAFTVAGIGVGVGGGTRQPGSASRRPAAAASTAPLRAAALLAAAAIAVYAGSLWISTRYEERGVALWRTAPVAAAADLRRAAMFDPLGSDALLLRGAITARRGNWKEARSAFAESLSRDRTNWYAWLQLALAEARLGHGAAASEAVQRAVALNPREQVARRLARSIRRHELPSQAQLEEQLAASQS